MRRHSTGALTEQQHQEQDKRYQQGHQYDYVIVGTGMSALAAGALLANAGCKVCLLEAHDAPGGYAHTFEMDDFHFCAQVHYIWGCAPGQAIHQFLSHLGLADDITFEPFDPEGYDHAALPDGKRVRIPYGFDKLVDNIDAAYPGQREALRQFVERVTAIRDEIRALPEQVGWWDRLSAPLRFPSLTKYKSKTQQQLFDECGLSKEAQAVLCADAGDLGSPPEELSVLAYASLLSGYNEGAYYPTKHFSHFIGRLAEFIEEQDGCHIYYETEVTGIATEGDKVTCVEASDGKVFSGDEYICNMDPQRAVELIGIEQVPEKFRSALSYRYSPSSIITYAGIKDIDLRDYGFGGFNIWHFSQWDMNKMWAEQMAGNFDEPWMFVSTPALRTSDTTGTPEGCQTMEFGALTGYEYFDEVRKRGAKAYRDEKRRIRDRFLDILEEKYIPGLRKHIKTMVTGSPTTNEDFCWAPHGNCYGSVMTPGNMGLDRLKEESPWGNLHWCNASSGYAGIHGTTLTGMHLYTRLSGDKVYDLAKRPTTEEAIRYATQRFKA